MVLDGRWRSGLSADQKQSIPPWTSFSVLGHCNYKTKKKKMQPFKDCCYNIGSKLLFKISLCAARTPLIGKDQKCTEEVDGQGRWTWVTTNSMMWVWRQTRRSWPQLSVFNLAEQSEWMNSLSYILQTEQHGRVLKLLLDAIVCVLMVWLVKVIFKRREIDAYQIMNLLLSDVFSRKQTASRRRVSMSLRLHQTKCQTGTVPVFLGAAVYKCQGHYSPAS